MNKPKKVLNLYAGIGGNRKLWTDVEVTAVELNPEIAKIYQDFFPDDKVIVADAHQYLLDHYADGWDFIWSSPPCPSHSGVNFFLNAQGCIRYPDMMLWQEIIFLTHFCKTNWVVENVETYYEPIIPPYNADRHFFWSNFVIQPWTDRKSKAISILNTRESTRRKSDEIISTLQDLHGFDLTKFDYPDKRKILANCVKPELGLHIFNMAFKHRQSTLGME